MSLDIDCYADFCKKAQTFYYLNKNRNHWKPQFAKSGADKRAAIPTGRQETKHPLEATVKSKLERELGEELPKVMLHIGGDNLRILNLLAVYALTIGNDVYIREEAYKEGSTETDKILLHEMVHVLQNKRNIKINSIDERNQAEAEAEQAEQEVYGDIWAEPYEIIEMNGQKVKFTQTKKKMFIEKVANNLEQWVMEQRMLLDEKEYLDFLCALEHLRNYPSLRAPRDSADALLLEIVEAFRRRLC